MIKMVEVGPRDGLQNETATVPTEAKTAFVDALSETGVGEIEVSAFVSPGRVPQLGDAASVFQGITRKKGVTYSALVPNMQGLERAVTAGVDKIAVFTAVSETFNRENIHTTLEGSLKRFQPVIQQAAALSLPVRGYISTAFWCAFEGRIEPGEVVDLARTLLEMGIDEVSISDTIGKATADDVKRLLDLLLPSVPPEKVAVHYHDTYGRGVSNVIVSLSYGIRIVDTSAGGLGGCPFAPGATGNVATEAVVRALADRGEITGVDVAKLIQARNILGPYLAEDRRSMPEADSRACSVCEFTRAESGCS